MDAAAWTFVVLTLSGITGLAFVRLGRKPAHDPLSDYADPYDAARAHTADLMARLYASEGTGVEVNQHDGRFKL